MLETHLRSWYQKYWVDPVAHWLKPYITPNQITGLSGLLGLVIVYLLYQDQGGLAIFTLLISGYLDTLDGTLARLNGCSSDWGAVLDIMTDRWVETCVMTGIWLMSPIANSLGVIMMLGSVLLCVTSFLVVGVFTANDSDKSFHYSPGIMERAEAFGFFIAMILCPQQFTLLAITFTVLVLITTGIRLGQFYKQYSHCELNN